MTQERDRDNDREKKSWREIDAMRNVSRHVQPDKKAEKKPYEVKRDESKAKAALENLFSGKKNKEQEAAWKHAMEGPSKTFSLRVNHYVEKFGLPRDWDDLLRLLDHAKPEFVLNVLARMLDRAPHESEIRRDLLVGKLRVLKMERDEPELLSKFEEAMKGLTCNPS